MAEVLLDDGGELGGLDAPYAGIVRSPDQILCYLFREEERCRAGMAFGMSAALTRRPSDCTLNRSLRWWKKKG
ncbi:hypothetical protein DSECCO2_546510 [anaerobic digester metagenome]